MQSCIEEIEKIVSQTSSMQSSLEEIKTMLSSQNANEIIVSAAPDIEFDSTNYDVNFDQQRSWKAARRQCQEKNMDLVSINSLQEFDDISKLLKKMLTEQIELEYCMGIWTSGNANNYNGDAVWLWGDSDEPVTYGWDDIEPADIRVKSLCAAMDYYLGFKMYSDDCGLTMNKKCYICEIIR